MANDLKRTAACALALLSLAACVPAPLNDAVLREGLQKYIAEHRPNQCLVVDRFPWDSAKAEPEAGRPQALRTSPPYLDLSQVAVLEKAGLVRRQPGSAALGGPERFELTDLGATHYQEHEFTDTVSGQKSVGASLCYAKLAVTGEIAWRQPRPEMAFVDYRIQFNEVAPWATDPQVLAAFEELRREMVPGPVALQSKSFVRTDQGWLVSLESGEARTQVKRIK